MEVKKYSKPEVSNKRIDFFLVGLAISVLMVFAAFSYKEYEEKKAELATLVIDEDLVVMENTVQERKPPPPPAPPTLEVVDDDVVIEEQPEILDTETDQEEEMTEYEEKEEKDEPEETNEVFEIFDVSEKAEFPGGEEGLQKFIAENITFPPMALENDQQGTVNIMFIVDKNGNVKDIAVLGSKKGFGLDEEAMRVINKTSGKWKPAKQRDKAVNMRFRIPVKFQIF